MLFIRKIVSQKKMTSLDVCARYDYELLTSCLRVCFKGVGEYFLCILYQGAPLLYLMSHKIRQMLELLELPIVYVLNRYLFSIKRKKKRKKLQCLLGVCVRVLELCVNKTIGCLCISMLRMYGQACSVWLSTECMERVLR